MPARTRSPQTRPHSAPAYYLARPANWWITVLRPQPRHPARRTAADPAVPAPDGPAAG